MNRIFTTLSVLLVVTGIFLKQQAGAQVPEKMSYQAVVRDNLDHLVSNHSVGIKLTILRGSPTGTVVYTETQTPATNANGLINIEFGGGTGFSSIDWSAGPYFLKTETDPAGGTSYTINGTSQMPSVPYAIHAKTAETVPETDPVFTSWDKQYADFKNRPDSISDFKLDANSQNINALANPVNAQDAATKAYVDTLLSRIIAMEYIILGFTDARDGNHYKAVTIGKQVWMAENLKYLPGVAGPDQRSYTSPYYYVYGYDGTNVTDAKATDNYSTYGVLYNWPAAMAGSAGSSTNPSGVQGVCPTGWHLPSDAEWTELTNTLGGLSEAGGRLKETGTIHWNSPNTGATNEVGFTALPGGDLYFTNIFKYIGNNSYWWSTTESEEYSVFYAWQRNLSYYDSRVYSWYTNKELGLSVRCVRD